MKQQYFLNDYLEHEKEKSIKDRLLYLRMAFRPAGVMVTCIILTIIISIPCLFVMKANDSESTVYAIAFALFTGVVASGLISLTIEMIHNYRHNYQRLLVLHEYLLTIAHYEDHVQWCLHGRTDADCPGTFTARNMATSELVLEIGPVMESAYKEGKEFMSLQEMKQVIKVVEAASKIGETAESFASENMIDATGSSLYDCMKEPFRGKLKTFAEDVGISLVEHKVGNVVADYVLTKPDELDELEQSELKNQLIQFDEGMCALKPFVGTEPGYHTELIPWETRFEKKERKIRRKSERAEEATRRKLQKAVEDGRITKGEFEEYLELNEEVSKADDLDLEPLYRVYGYDDDEAFDKAMQEMIERKEDERHKKLMRVLQIIAKAEGHSFDLNEYHNRENKGLDLC